MLPRTHGSALFTRGETQALVVATLGTGEDEQIVDALRRHAQERFMLHYNFPPFSVGETRPHGRARPARDRPRQAGRARPASRCCRARRSSPTRSASSPRSSESNGSSSMATVCGGSLALMDAGVPIEGARGRHRHGPDQGGQRASPCSPTSWATRTTWATWTSRSPARENGITALQMDIKIAGITEEIMRVALEQAHARPPAHPGRDGQGHLRRRAPSSASTRRASRPSRSRSTRSARSSARAAR